MANPSFVVLKLGGTSVADTGAWPRMVAELRARQDEGLQPVLVLSALSGVTNDLVALVEAAVAQQPWEPLLARIEAAHQAWASAMARPLAAPVTDELSTLRRMAEGVSLLGEASPRVRALVLSAGERMSTWLVADWLSSQGLPARWRDARELLCAEAGPNPEKHFLSAVVRAGRDPELMARLWAEGGLVVTQGFVARDAQGQTVVLGRGGSDTSASLLGAALAAARVEIWTDVPGLFTANPRMVAGARLIGQLDYDEAQEIASMGAKVLHPACLLPARQHDVPIEIRCTPHPEWPRTRIGGAESPVAGVKAISSRSGLVLVSMETVGMWQEVGFLARAFQVFADQGLSIDLVATSETSVTVSLDPAANVVGEEALEALRVRLSTFCQARILRGAASVSLVGRRIRSILHRLSGVFELFEEQRVHLVSQAASDLNLTVVVDEDQAPRLVRQLHALLFGELEAVAGLGPTWSSLSAGLDPSAAGAAAAPAGRPPWWIAARERLLQTAAARTPCYAYSTARIQEAAAALRGLSSVDRVLFAIKANPNPEVLRVVVAAGLGLETVSPRELARARDILGPEGGPLLFTPNFAPIEDYVAGFAAGARVTLDNDHPLRAHPEVFAGREVFLRIDPGAGAGHHKHVRTAGAVSKFGLPAQSWASVAALCAAHRVTVVGLHAHVGSGVKDPEAWPRTAEILARVAEAHFPSVQILDLGGGLGVPEKRGQEPLDLTALDVALAGFKAAWPRFQLWLEPGRFVIAEAGVLLARVTQLKDKGQGHRYVGVDAGMNTLIRPALYGAFHEIVNLSRLHQPGPWIEADVVGPICETGDVLGHDRRLVEPVEGDVVLISNGGAYGAAMASDYNLRGRVVEVMLE